MPHVRFVTALVATVAAMSFSTGGLVSPSAAQADRCQPEELVGLPPLTSEEQNPFCQLMLNEVYPRLSCDSTTMRRCLDTLSLAWTYYKNTGEFPPEYCIALSFSHQTCTSNL
jgi:hypothetical protein